jgi:carboxymethylenebutenolidase
MTKIISQDIGYYRDANGFLAKPEKGKYPGIVMIHEWWGLNSTIKDAAKKLSSEGYIVLAVDLYGGFVAKTPDEAMKKVQSIDQQQANKNMISAVKYLKQDGATTIGSIGWCFGGGQSLQLALATKLDATIIYYGFLVQDKAKLSNIKWPVLGIFGDKDEAIPVEKVHEFKSTLDSLGIKNEIHIYPGVGHAFANPTNPSHAVKETSDAWKRTLDFFKRTLKT